MLVGHILPDVSHNSNAFTNQKGNFNLNVSLLAHSTTWSSLLCQILFYTAIRTGYDLYDFAAERS